MGHVHGQGLMMTTTAMMPFRACPKRFTTASRPALYSVQGDAASRDAGIRSLPCNSGEWHVEYSELTRATRRSERGPLTPMIDDE